MSTSQLKRAVKAIEAILTAGDPPQAGEIGLALQELLEDIHGLELRVISLEINTRSVRQV